jgi:hypothetical protein
MASAGGAVAIDLAAARDSRDGHRLIVESSFTSLPNLCRTQYGWLPLQLLLSQKFDSVAKIQQVRMPVLIVHGEDDRYVPPRLSSALHAAAPQPKKLLLIPNGTHNNGVFTGHADYRLALQELFGPLKSAPKDNTQNADMLLREHRIGRQPTRGPQRSGSEIRRSGLHSGLTLIDVSVRPLQVCGYLRSSRFYAAPNSPWINESNRTV